MYKQYLLIIVLFFSGVSFADSLKLGILPYLSTATLLKVHNPVAVQLSSELGVKVNMVSEPSYDQFLEATKNKKFDFVLTGPTMGALAVLQSGYQLLVVPGNKSHAVFVSLKSSPFQDLSNANSARIALLQKQSVMSLLAKKKLTETYSLSDLNLTYSKTHGNALQAVLKGDADIAVMGLHAWRRYNKADKNLLSVIAVSDNITGIMILANPDMDKVMVKKAIEALLNLDNTELGAAYYKRSKWLPFRPLTQQDITTLEPFVGEIHHFKK
ncbi:MAG: phosphate/phosphite/phosphonate ABC transporter substrate-binding protein [Methylophagaceae bacterium]